MPKKDIDYSNTIFYKIICCDKNIKDLYVGHTTNFIQRKHAHKQSCLNNKNVNYNCKLYKIIRENGNWENWEMIIIDFLNCKNSIEARIKEQEHYEKLQATMNSLEPYKIKQEIIKIEDQNEKTQLYCEKCDIYTNTQKQMNIHYKTKQHMTTISCKKMQYNFICKDCDFHTSNKYNFDKHFNHTKT